MSWQSELPTLETARLRLRPFSVTDAECVRTLAGDWEIADKTLTVPHPYEEGVAEAWIATHRPGFRRGELLALAMTLLTDHRVIGAIGFKLEVQHARGTLGYWVGRDYWAQVFCTEAGRAVLKFGFDTLGLNKVDAECLSRNPASARVLEKLGMSREGEKRQHYQKWGKFEDVEQYGLLQADYSSA